MEFRLIVIIVNIVAIFLLSVVGWLILLCVLHEFVVVFVIVIDIVFCFVLCYCFFDIFLGERETMVFDCYWLWNFRVLMVVILGCH